MKAATLLYHDVVDGGRYDESGFRGPGPDRYKLEAAEFDRHLDALAERGDAPVRVADVREQAEALCWLLTFDDGGASARVIGERLAERGWPGHFFVTVDYIGRAGFVTKQDMRALSDLGHIVGSHSCSHPERMSRCSWQQLLDEWGRSIGVLGEILGRPVAVASVPGGYYTEVVARAAAAVGIEALFTSEPVLGVREVDSCRVFGRFVILRGVSSQTAAELASASVIPRLRQFTSWNAKKVVKTVGGEKYLRLRRALLARR